MIEGSEWSKSSFWFSFSSRTISCLSSFYIFFSVAVQINRGRKESKVTAKCTRRNKKESSMKKEVSILSFSKRVEKRGAKEYLAAAATPNATPLPSWDDCGTPARSVFRLRSCSTLPLWYELINCKLLAPDQPFRSYKNRKKKLESTLASLHKIVETLGRFLDSQWNGWYVKKKLCAWIFFF